MEVFQSGLGAWPGGAFLLDDHFVCLFGSGPAGLLIAALGLRCGSWELLG